MAVLEEWLQEKYVEYYAESNNFSNKPELLNSKINGLLFKDGSKNYITYNGKKYYLINKHSLPLEIANQLIGGNTTSKEYAKYIRLMDVYGMTSDLKVYYCDENGLSGNVLGTIESLEIDLNEKAILANNNSVLSSELKKVLDSLGKTYGDELTVGEVNNVKSLTISDSNLSSLEGISEVRNLKNLILKDLTIPNLNGIESCNFLETIYIDNCIIKELNGYDELATVLGLKKLYFNFSSSLSETDSNAQVERISNGLSQASGLNKLEYFGIFGDYSFIQANGDTNFLIDPNSWQADNLYSKWEKIANNLSDISSFSQINSTVKNAVKYMFLNNNNIKNIESLNGFSNIYELALTGNLNLASFKGLENHTNLAYLFSKKTNVTDLDGLAGCSNLIAISLNDNPNLSTLRGLSSKQFQKLYAANCRIENIKALEDCLTITYLNLENNTDSVNSTYHLSDISPLKKCTLIKQCYLKNNNQLDEEILSSAEFKNMLNNCGVYYSLDTKYGLLFLDVAMKDFSDYGLTNSQLELLRGNKSIKGLKLTGNPDLSNEKVNDILSTMTNLECVCLKNMSQMTTIGFYDDLDNLHELDLRGTGITDLSSLEKSVVDEKCKLGVLFINNSEIDVTSIQKLISFVSVRHKPNQYSFEQTGGYASGILIENKDLIEDIALCTEITDIFTYEAKVWGCNATMDLSNCSNFNSFLLRAYTVNAILPASTITLLR